MNRRIVGKRCQVARHCAFLVFLTTSLPRFRDDFLLRLQNRQTKATHPLLPSQLQRLASHRPIVFLLNISPNRALYLCNIDVAVPFNSPKAICVSAEKLHTDL